MGLGIDLATQNFLCTGNDQRRHLFAQLFLGADSFLFDFCLGAGDDLVGFDFGSAFGFFDDLLRTLFGLSHEIRGFLLGFAQRVGGTLGSELLLVLAALGRSQAISASPRSESRNTIRVTAEKLPSTMPSTIEATVSPSIQPLPLTS